jgi:hypothetical protein
MSWLVSLVLAGMVFTSDGKLPIQANSNYIETNSTQVVMLDETERFEQTYPLNANGRVSVTNVNGPITVEAWDRNEVKLTAIKTADTREHLADVQIKIDARPEAIRIEADYEAWNRNNNGAWKNRDNYKLEVEFRLMVPRGAVLNQIEAVNGSITVMNMTNITRVTSVNGEVKAVNLRGTARLETVNGGVEADFNTLQAGSQITLATVNGRANLIIPSDANATIRAETTNGTIANDFGLPIRKGEYVGRDLYGKVGSGDVRVRLESVNGPLSIRRKQDGKTLNPATNLLRNTPKDSQDDDNDIDSESVAKAKSKAKVKAKPGQFPVIVTVPDVNVQVPPINIPMPEVNVDVYKEMAKAHKEFAKIDQKELNGRIRESMERQREAMERLRDNVWFVGSPSIEKKSDAFAVKGVPRVTIDAKDCAVVVRGWDKQEVQYSMTRFARTGNQTPMDAKVDHTDSDVTIRVAETTGQSTGAVVSRRDVSRTRIEVFVPKKSNLRIITNREIRLENVSGEIDLQGGGEAVNVRDVDGKLTVGTTDGRIRIIGFRGDFDGKTEQGLMNLEGDFRKFNVQGGDGTIVLTLAENTNAVLETNTEIESEGLNLIRKNDDANIWRIGSGGTTYRMTVADGKVIVRNAGAMKTVWQ